MLTIGAANILFALAPNFELLIILRFVLGIGASMFFSPALAVVAPLFRNQRQGLAIGIYNAAFNVGGAIGLFGWTYLVADFGWRLALIIGAVLAIGFGLENFVVIKHETGVEKIRRSFGMAKKALRDVLYDRQIWLLGIGFIGLWAGLYSIVQLMPYYEETVRGVSPLIASTLATIIFLLPIFVGPLGGHLSDRIRNRRVFLVYPTIVFAIATALIGYANIPAATAIMITVGVCDALVYMAMYAIPFESNRLRDEQKAISISLINSIQISGSFVVPIIFSAVAYSSLGFQGAWIFVGIFVLAFVPAALLVKDTFSKESQSVTAN